MTKGSVKLPGTFDEALGDLLNVKPSPKEKLRKSVKKTRKAKAKFDAADRRGKAALERHDHAEFGAAVDDERNAIEDFNAASSILKASAERMAARRGALIRLPVTQTASSDWPA